MFKSIIKEIIDSIPDSYRPHQQFVNCVDFYSHGEFGLALESLIELDNESETDFPEYFWRKLAYAANKMNLVDMASYCNKQVQQMNK